MLMSSKEYLDRMKEIQNNILDFLNLNDDNEEKFENFKSIISDLKIQNDHYEFKALLDLISHISDNHIRNFHLNNKIERILQILEINKYFSNREIFNIFQNNKQILLFLIEEKMIVIDEYIATQMTTDRFKKLKYPEFFFNEIKPFLDSNYEFNFYFSGKKKIDNEASNPPENFSERRNIGENEDFVCDMIRKDLIEEFITHVNKTNMNLDMSIKRSIFETNAFLFKKRPTLIEYAAFFGSIQIFKYLLLNHATLKPSLWIYAIHGADPEIIHIIEEKIGFSNEENEEEEEEINSKLANITPMKCFLEAIKCHHNDIANYILNNYLKDQKIDSFEFISKFLQYYNFSFINPDSLNESYFYCFCEYDHYYLINLFLSSKDFDVNQIKVLTIFYFNIICIWYYFNEIPY